jgi:hypothetical protein
MTQLKQTSCYGWRTSHAVSRQTEIAAQEVQIIIREEEKVARFDIYDLLSLGKARTASAMGKKVKKDNMIRCRQRPPCSVKPILRFDAPRRRKLRVYKQRSVETDS